MSDPQTPSQPGSAPGAPGPASSKGDPAGPTSAPGTQGASTTKGASPKKSDSPAGGATKPGSKPAGSKPAGTSGTPPAKDEDPLRRSRAGGFYLAIIGLAVVLVLLIIFVVQNTETTTVRFLSFEGETPVAVALLAAAAAGIFLASIAASLRILQLRRRVKHDRKS